MSKKSAKRNKARRNKAKRDRMELQIVDEAEELTDTFSSPAAGPSSAFYTPCPMEKPSCFDIRNIPGKGLGLVATVDILKAIASSRRHC